MPLPFRVTASRRGDRARLEALTQSCTVSQRVVERARIVMRSADGRSGLQICAELGVSRPMVTRWMERYSVEGLASLSVDRPRAGRPKRIASADEVAIIARTLETAPPSGTHWSTRIIAVVTGHHHATIARILRAHGLKPHRTKRFTLSRDPHFVDKLRDVVGFYLDLPKRAGVFSFDEKSRIQALDRTQPGVPETHRARRLQELDIHVILDNDATHRGAGSRGIPGCIFTSPRRRRGSTSWNDSSVSSPSGRPAASRSRGSPSSRYIDQRNANPAQFVWTASVQ